MTVSPFTVTYAYQLSANQQNQVALRDDWLADGSTATQRSTETKESHEAQAEPVTTHMPRQAHINRTSLSMLTLALLEDHIMM